MKTTRFLSPFLGFVMVLDATRVFAGVAVPEFDDAPGNFYNYAATCVETAPSIRYIWYCKNRNSGKIIDSIYSRKAVKNGSVWSWGEQAVALSPGVSNAWDCVHVCDPAVVRGKFLHTGTNYSYAMFFLGCDTLKNTHNQIGVAFASSPDGPWVKFPGNPIITCSGNDVWGVGQPSVTSVDGAGKMLLFFTRGDKTGTRMLRSEVNFANTGSFTVGAEVVLPTDGLTEADGSKVVLHNGALAYDGNNDRFYLVRDRMPNPTSEPNYISSQLQVAFTTGSAIWSGKGSWTVAGNVTATQSGKARNHHGCLLTDAYGGLLGGAANYQVNFVVANEGPGSLWTYRIHTITKSNLGMP